MKRCFMLMMVLLISIGCYSKKEEYSNKKAINRIDDEWNYATASISVKKEMADISFGRFNGRETLYRIELIESREAFFDYNAKIEEGKFKLVAVSGKGIETIVEGSENGVKRIILPKGETRIKIIGDEAKGSIVLKVGNVEVEVLKS